ncbi:TPA: hypothetical protein L4U31_002837 [Pseudomonas aeruginosa]|nr:hypothetical protein [Pseudomonas aeruginosa]
MTPVDIVALLQQALDASSKLRELSKKVEDVEFRMLLADLQTALADAKLESVDLKVKLAAAQEQVLALQQQIQSTHDDRPTITDLETYAFYGETGHYCTGCWDIHQRKVRLRTVPADFQFAGKLSCPGCGAHYGGQI